MGRTATERASLYAAYKLIEGALKEDGELPPGFSADVSGTSVTVLIPAGTRISRDAGPNGDGTIEKKATTNLYGYAVWAAFLKRLSRFNQASVIRRMLMEAWSEALANGKSVESELNEIDPEIGQFIADLKKAPGPLRVEQTTRRITRPEAEAIMLIQAPKSGRQTA